MSQYTIITTKPRKPLFITMCAFLIFSLVYFFILKPTLFSFLSFETNIVIASLFLLVGLILAGMLHLYSSELFLNSEKLEIINKKKGTEQSRDIFEKKDIDSVIVKVRQSSGIPIILVKISTKKGFFVAQMRSFAEAKKFIEEWNKFGYPAYVLPSWGEMSKYFWVKPFLYAILCIGSVIAAIVWVKY